MLLRLPTGERCVRMSVYLTRIQPSPSTALRTARSWSRSTRLASKLRSLSPRLTRSSSSTTVSSETLWKRQLSTRSSGSSTRATVSRRRSRAEARRTTSRLPSAAASSSRRSSSACLPSRSSRPVLPTSVRSSPSRARPKRSRACTLRSRPTTKRRTSGSPSVARVSLRSATSGSTV